MDRDQPFTKYLHDAQQRLKVPMHSHANGQLNFVGKGTMHLLSPQTHWVVPWQRIIWIPPGQLHSVRCEKLFGSWKAMIPRDYAQDLPREICVLQTSPLLLAVLDALPVCGSSIPSEKFAALVEIIRQELPLAQREAFGVALPSSEALRRVAEKLLEHPGDLQGIDAWAQSIGMSRRTFTRHFAAETGSSFGQWKKNVLLGWGLSLLAEGKTVAETADMLGYAYPSAFVAAFRRRYGASPLRFKR